VWQHGNESHTGRHINGKLNSSGDMESIEVRAPEKSHCFPIHIWSSHMDRLSVSVKSPTGEVVSGLAAKTGTSLVAKLHQEKSTVEVRYFFPTTGAENQLSIVHIFNPTPGIWTIRLHGDVVTDGSYDAWLPVTGHVTEGVEFLAPTPDRTIVIPATTVGVICCGAYDFKTNNLQVNSSWGPTRIPTMGITLTAPGEDVLRCIS